MKRFINIVAIAFLLVATSACKSYHYNIGDEYSTFDFKTQCLNIDPNGTLTLRAWGSGANKSKAIAHAQRKALESVIFDGITNGAVNCDKRPLIFTVNARERYKVYFDNFFSSDIYKKYVTLDNKKNSRIKSSNSTMETWGVVVYVNRDALRQHLTEDNIIN